MDMNAVARGLAAAAENVTSDPALITHAFTPDSLEVPTCFVAEYDIEFDKAYGRALDAADITMRVLVSRTDDKSGAERLNNLLSGHGGTTLKEAIEADRLAVGGTGLGGAADDHHVERIQGMRWYIHDQITYLGAELRIHVIGSSR
jgi:hypothetical protein